MGGIQKIDTSLEKLKKVVTNQNLQEKKKLIRYKKFYNHSVTCGVALHYLIDKKMYECYMYLSTPEQIVGNLCYKMDTSKLKIFCLYHYLCFLLKHISIEKIVYKLMKLYKI